MHILFIPTWFESPAHPVSGRAMKDLAYALVRKGVKVNFLFQSGEKLPPVSRLEHGVEIWNSYSTARGKLYPLWNSGSLLSYQNTFENYLSGHGRPDLIHVHSYPVLAIAQLLRRKYGIPFVYTEHSSKIAGQKINFIERMLINHYLEEKTPVFTVSHFLKESLSAYIRHPIRVLPNTIDFGLFSPGQPARPRHILMVNTLDKNKQVDLGIKAFACWHRQHPDAKLHIIGDGPERYPLKRLTQKLGLEERVLLWGEQRVEQWLPLMRSASCFLLMSRSESFGVVVLEALASQVPVVALQNNGIADMPLAPGLYILPLFSNEVDVSQAIEQAITEYDEGQLVQSRASLQSLFDYPVVAGKYMDEYQKLLNK